MQQNIIIRQLANEHITHFNKLARSGQAASMELQTEVVLETLAELAYRNNLMALYEQINERKHALWLHAPMASITAGDAA